MSRHGLEHFVAQARLTVEQPVQRLLVDGQRLEGAASSDGCRGRTLVEERQLAKDEAFPQRGQPHILSFFVLFVHANFPCEKEIDRRDLNAFVDQVVPLLPLLKAADGNEELELMFRNVGEKWNGGQCLFGYHGALRKDDCLAARLGYRPGPVKQEANRKKKRGPSPFLTAELTLATTLSPEERSRKSNLFPFLRLIPCKCRRTYFRRYCGSLAF